LLDEASIPWTDFGGGSFAHALIGAVSAKEGCSRVVTFDRKAVRLPGFELL